MANEPHESLLTIKGFCARTWRIWCQKPKEERSDLSISRKYQVRVVQAYPWAYKLDGGCFALSRGETDKFHAERIQHVAKDRRFFRCKIIFSFFL